MFSTMFSIAGTALALASVSAASALPVSSRDVWDPAIFTPTSETLWYIGQEYTVTWNTSNPPQEVTDVYGRLYLTQGDSGQAGPTLAQGFPLSDGEVSITVPDVQPALNWKVVLMGDSGDYSAEFRIESAPANA